MRVLIVGAGIAGAALAALLRRQGKDVVLIEKQPKDAALGYVLALWPQGSRVLNALGVHDAFIAASEPMLSYTLRNGRGELIGSYDMQELTKRFGHLGAISRPDLMTVLYGALGDVQVQNGVGVESLSQAGDRVNVRLTDGVETSFDLVVGADGIHSRVRELLFGRLPEWDTGWGCFAWWGDSRLTAKGETIECWGAGSFLGMYPTRDSVGIIVGAPIDVLKPDNPDGRTGRLETLLARHKPPLGDVLAGLPGDKEPLFLWRMADVRAPRWVERRTVLVGDAASAFLPTAGIGASMALESAAVLAEELSRTDAQHLENALDLYVKRRRHRVEESQNQSRWLARLVLLRSRPLTSLRNRAMRFVSMEQMLRPLVRQLTQPI